VTGVRFSLNWARLRNRQVWFKTALLFGCLVGTLLLVQSIAGYLYVSRTMERDQLRHVADQLAVRLEGSARKVGSADTRTMGRLMEELIDEEQQQKIAWLRVLVPSGRVLVQAGTTFRPPVNDKELRRLLDERVPIHHLQNTVHGRVFITVVALHVRVALHDLETRPEGRPAPRLLEIALYEDMTARTFTPLRVNLLVASLAALMLVGSMLLLARSLKGYLRGQQSEQQMAIARRVQRELLPSVASSYDGLECAGVCIPALQVGGDFYDVFATTTGTTALIVGDVAGKGLGAALLMSLLHGAIRCSNWTSISAHEDATKAINTLLFSSTAPESFATLFWGYYDRCTLYYVNAGHCPPLLLRGASLGDLHVEKLTEGGPVIGALRETRYQQGAIIMEPSDLLVLYSDGVVEEENQFGEEFGEERLQNIVSKWSDRPCAEICDHIVEGVRAFAHTVSQRDDLTVVVVRASRVQG
jgi:serine phosphatase RsbU (regulator of sigma subunit)